MSETIYYMDSDKKNDIPISATELSSGKTLIVPSEAFDPSLMNLLINTARSLVTDDNYGKGCGYLALGRETYPQSHAFWTNALADIDEYGFIKLENEGDSLKITKKQKNMVMEAYFGSTSLDSNITFRVWNDLDVPEDVRSIYVAAIYERMKSAMPD